MNAIGDMLQQTVHKEGLQSVGRIVFDAVAYATVLTAATTAVAVSAGITTGGGLVRGKVLLFVAGWLLLAYATAKLWPTSREKTASSGRSIPGHAQATRFQSFVDGLAPFRWIQPPPPEKRITVDGKLFLAGCFVLLVSFLMERWFGI